MRHAFAPDHGRRHPQRLPARPRPCSDGPPVGRRLRRPRARARVRHARVRHGRGRPARAGPRLPRRAASRHGDQGEVLFASKACPATAVLRAVRRGGPGLRRRVRRRAAPGAEGGLRARAHLRARQRQVRRPSCARRSTPASAGSSSTTLEDVAKLAGMVGAGARQRVLLRIRPGVDADTHAAILTGHADSKFGLDPRDAARARRRSAGAPRRPGASTSTSARSSSTRRRTARRSGRWPASAASPSTTSAAASPSPTPTTTARRRSPTWSRRSSRPRTTRSARTRGSCSSRAARSSPTPA